MIAPACHGSAVAVSASSETCRACPHSRSCLRDARAFVLALPDDELSQGARRQLALTTRALLTTPASAPEGQGAPTTRAPLTVAESALVASLPKRVASQVRGLLETGWFDYARSELAAGRNPAAKGWKHVYCQQLLTGRATRETLRMALIESLDLTPASAKVQLCNALSIFAAGNLAVESGGQLRLIAKQSDRP